MSRALARPLGMTFGPERPVYDEDIAGRYDYFPVHARFAPVFAQATDEPAADAGMLIAERLKELVELERRSVFLGTVSTIAIGVLAAIGVTSVIASAAVATSARRAASGRPLARPRWR